MSTSNNSSIYRASAMPQKNSEKMASYYKGLQKHKRKKVTTQDDDTCLKTFISQNLNNSSKDE